MAGDHDAVPRGRRPVRQATLLALALLALQAAWVLTVPPFRGIDEFDHVYRAAAVAHGQVMPSERPVTDGRGDYVEVPSTLVTAATAVCESYLYTGPDNCRAARELSGGYVEVASAAARYHPAFYWLVGTASSAFEGAPRVYAMRVAGALLCAVLVACAAYALGLGSRSRWPLLGLGVAATPVFVYSTSLGAPNGIEMCAGLALWCAVIGLGGTRLTRRDERWLLLLAAAAGSVLVTTRLLGPVWFVAVVVAAAPLLGRERLRSLLARHRRTCAASVAAVAAAAGAAAWWTVVARPNSLSGGDARPHLDLPDPVRTSLGDVPLWVLQSVAAFPTRSEPAPSVVYAAGLAALGLVGVMVVRRVPARWRWWLAGTTALWVGMQLAVALATYQHLGPAWQGRYALPFAIGIPVAACALVARYADAGPPRPVAGVVVAMVAGAHAVSTVDVLRGELRSSPLSGDPAWVAAPAWLLVVLTLVGVGLGVLAARPGARGDERPAGAVGAASHPAERVPV